MASPSGPVEGALSLTYDRPAANWMQSGLPIGNGHMGAMIYGDERFERIQFNEESLWMGNEDDTGAYQNFGEVTVRFGEADVISNPSHHVSSAEQGVSESVDGDAGTKWCIEHKGRFPIVWQMDMARPAPVSSYTLTSADDVPARDPKAWRFLGSADGQKWTLLDARKDIPVWRERHTPQTFSFRNTTGFAHYRFEFLETHDAPHFQLAEIVLGSDAPALDYAANRYHRELDLSSAVYRASYEQAGVKYVREAFASFPAKVVVVRFTADRPGAISCEVSLNDAHGAKTAADAAGLSIKGAFPGYQYDGNRTWLPLNREAQLRVVTEGGAATALGGKIRVEKANALTLYLDAGTDFKQDRAAHWRGPAPHAAIGAHLDVAVKAPYATLLADHLRDYRRLFDRVSLSLPAGSGAGAAAAQTTEWRLKHYSGDAPDLGLEELLFQYGRYLLISSSREGGLPANLQGKWNNSNNPPWRSDYHTDVNVEMNYWMADTANLGECFQPFAAWINSIRAVRTEATQKAFHSPGWVMRGESGLFGGSTWEWTPATSAWLMQNMFDHFAFTRDKEYLRTQAYPPMKEVCAFWLDRLKALPDGRLVAPDGFSPEHGPREDGVSFEQQLIWNLFTDTIEAADVLGVDKDFREMLVGKRAKLLGPKIGKWGQLQEWMTDRDDPNDTHRHLSHLIAVHPGREITFLGTPELARAARVSLAARGDDSTGWGTTWRMNQWARLHDGDHAHKLFRYLIRPCDVVTMANEGGGLYPNLLDACPPFQIDGNFGYASAVCEMLLQSHAGEIELLPALPKAWAAQGAFKGLRARGGFVVDCVWRGGVATAAAITGSPGASAIARIGNRRLTATIPASGVWRWTSGVFN